MLKTTWRHLIKDRQFTILNLAGLSTGLACALLIGLWIHDELNIDKFHRRNVYQVMLNENAGDRIATREGTGNTVGDVLLKSMPEVEYTATTTPAAWFRNFNLSRKENTLSAKGNFVSKGFFSVFSYELLQGDRVLENKNSIVISAQLAKKLFHSVDSAIGKELSWKWLTFGKPCIVSGVFKDFPVNSTAQYDFVLPLEAWYDIVPSSNTLTGPFNTYIVSAREIPGKQITDLLHANFNDTITKPFLRSYADGYLYGKYENGVQAGGRIGYVKLFTVIAIFILLIACINFMNLSTAKASRRIKEISVKKSLGAGRFSLVRQFLGESVLMSLAALLIALLIVWALLPQFRQLTGKVFVFDPALLLAVLGITLLTGLVAGSYPAFYLSRFQALKGAIHRSAGELWARKGLVTFQFTVSAVFIIAVLVVYNQISYVETKSPGYNKDNVLCFELQGRAAEKAAAFLAEVKDIPGVVNVSSIEQQIILPSFVPDGSVRWEGKNQDGKIRFNQMPVNYDLIETLDMQMMEGRSFSRNYASDTGAVILNETAIKAMDIKDPIGKTISLGQREKRIVGVVKDFHFNSLHEAIRPFIFKLAPQETMLVMAKIKAGQEKATIARINGLWNTFNPGFFFDYRFLDNDYQVQYASEKLVATISRYFAGLAIIISCLGLFGLAAFTAERRRKEIGIRKVLGATVGNFVLMLSKDFLQLVLIAILIAFPLAWWAMTQWLNDFAYHVPLGMSVFVATGCAIILITLLTVGYQAIRSALANPVNSLKAE
ncbi:ABC transporter permease [Chitinophaga niabensis]|uniref:ABC transporter permease n=1 Tax=Chitinophaga niabensis TaxID=536979 RepID=UPI0031B9D417